MPQSLADDDHVLPLLKRDGGVEVPQAPHGNPRVPGAASEPCDGCGEAVRTYPIAEGVGEDDAAVDVGRPHPQTRLQLGGPVTSQDVDGAAVEVDASASALGLGRLEDDALGSECAPVTERR